MASGWAGPERSRRPSGDSCWIWRVSQPRRTLRLTSLIPVGELSAKRRCRPLGTRPTTRWLQLQRTRNGWSSRERCVPLSSFRPMRTIQAVFVSTWLWTAAGWWLRYRITLADRNEWVGDTVRVQGVCAALFNDNNQLIGLIIHTPSPNYIKDIEVRSRGGFCHSGEPDLRNPEIHFQRDAQPPCPRRGRGYCLHR